MPGTGACDIKGVIPYAAIPQVYDPPSHVLATANQRPVTAAYPYYIGTSADFFDPGYRAATIYAALESAPLTPASFAAVQTSLTDQLAVRIVPKLLPALAGVSLSYSERAVVSLLRTWHGTMATQFAVATVWWTFWGDYLSADLPAGGPTTVFAPARTAADWTSPSASSAWTRTSRRGRCTTRRSPPSRCRPASCGRRRR